MIYHFKIIRYFLYACILLHATLNTIYASDKSGIIIIQFDIVGMNLIIDPYNLTVPKNITTQVNTSLTLPSGAGPELQGAVAAMASQGMVEAQLRGPSITPQTLRAKPGQPLILPSFALAGDYFLDQIHLVKDGQVIMDATPSMVPIKVINDVMVTSVSSRTLSAAEIQQKGIVIDQSNFQVSSFQMAFNINNKPFSISVPVATLHTSASIDITKSVDVQLATLADLNKKLQELTTTTLPPEFDRPGLNFSLAALPFLLVHNDDDEWPPPFTIPPINGLLVIPGNIGFLDQFFSVMAMVTNVAPDGTVLSLRDVKAEISLPTGLDQTPGTYDAPGDDPLRLARVKGVGQQSIVPVVNPGPDGTLGTADDIPTITPQQTGKGEFLVEGLREGSSDLNITITATLHGLPSGPVKLKGKAVGSVFVRNPTFAITLSHPATVRSGEAYDLYAIITNTSTSSANLVSISLDRRSISGARLTSDETVRFDAIPAGQSVTAKFSLVSETTGYVSFSQFTRDPGLSGSFQLRTGVGERGVPLAPNAIVLPATAGALPPGLVNAALRVLGQAFSIATAPAAALPPNVLYVKKQTVIDRGRSLGFAGQMLQFGEPLPRALAELLLEWLGGVSVDDGFDQLLRTTDAGKEFMSQLAAALQSAGAGAGVLDLQQGFARDTVTDQPHLSAALSSLSGAPVTLRLIDSGGNAVGIGTGTTLERTLPYADLLPLSGPGSGNNLAVAVSPGATPYTIQVTGSGPGVFDLGIVVPTGTDQLTQFRFRSVAIAAGRTGRVVVTPGSAGPYQLIMDGGAIITADIVTLNAGAQQLLSVRQIDPSSLVASIPLNTGTYIGVLFDREVTQASAEAVYQENPATVGNYTVDDNLVVAATLQPGGRLVYLGLRKPVGGMVPRSLTVTNISDLRGNLIPATTLPISTILNDGARVFGQVRQADGTPVPGALVTGIVYAFDPTIGDISPITLTRFFADSSGNFNIDYIPRGYSGQSVIATHPVTGDTAESHLLIMSAGQRILVNPIFLGRGTVRGRVLNSDGITPVAGAPVYLTPVQGQRTGVNANRLGEFVFTHIPVGTFTLESFLGASRDSGQFGLSEGVVASTGQETVKDIIIVNHDPNGLGSVTGRVFLSDGQTPATGFTVYLGTYNVAKGSIQAVQQTVTDAAGSFSFSAISSQTQAYDLVAVDLSGKQTGRSTVTVLARTTTSAVIVMEALGSVEGVVYNALNQPVPGAIIAGGVTLGTTDANGYFRIEGVPAGTTIITAGDPTTKRRGSQSVTVVPGQAVRVAITLESRATILGEVRDNTGAPVPNATVRLPNERGTGFILIVANAAGLYKVPDLPLGDYLIEAEPFNEDIICALASTDLQNTISPFTLGDMPAKLCGGITPTGNNQADAAQALYKNALITYVLGVAGRLDRLLPPAGFGYTRVRLFQDSSLVTANIRFLSSGTVSGVTQDSAGLPTGAKVRITYTTLEPKSGLPKPNFLESTSDPASGAFSFSGIPLFDLTTFQTSGLRFGDFRLLAATPFSPTMAQGSGALNVNNPSQSGIVLRFPATLETNGTLAGTVFMPDGTTPAPAGTQVAISFGTLTITTDANGRFVSQLPIPAGSYSLNALEPVSGLTGSGACTIIGGVQSETTIRLLGLGRVIVTVKRANGSAVAGARVTLSSANPGSRDGVTDAAGSVSFGNIREGEFSVEATDPATGLSGRGGGVVLLNGEVAVTVFLGQTGTVTGNFFASDGHTPLVTAQIVLRSVGSASSGFATTDAAGRFSFSLVPVGSFVVEGRDLLTGMTVSGVSGKITFDGDIAAVTLIEAPRGNVTGTVLKPDGSTPDAGAAVCLMAGLTAPVGAVASGTGEPNCASPEAPPSLAFDCAGLQATTAPDGSFSFAGVPAGYFSVSARDLLKRTQGGGGGRLSVEGETVPQTINLAGGEGSVKVTVLNGDTTPATNAEVKICGPLGYRTAPSDTLGSASFTTLVLGTYTLTAHSLAVTHDGGSASVAVQQSLKPEEVTVKLRGSSGVTVTVLSAAGAPVPSAKVTLNAYGPFGGQFLAFTDSAGKATFTGIPVDKFYVLAEDASLAGITPGEIVTSGQTVSLTVILSASGAVKGRVLLPGGSTLAAQAIVTLTYTPPAPSQSGTVQMVTGLDGLFQFSGIPIGPVSLTFFELVSQGVANAADTLASDGQMLDLGDLILDNVSPRVVLIDPTDGAGNVAPDVRVRLSFSKPVVRSSVTTVDAPSQAANLRLMKGTAPVAFSFDFTDSDRTVIIAPSDPLKSSGHYTVTVLGGADGPSDLVGLKTLDPFVSSFTVRDTIPPQIISSSPANVETQVPPETVVRVVFSEAVASGFTMTMTDAAGKQVNGRIDLALGGTTAIFTPVQLLQPNGIYTLVMSGVTDLAGNSLNGRYTATFSTVDTLAPVISSLQLQGGGAAVAGTTVTLQPNITAPDVAGVTYQIPGLGTQVVTTAPYTLTLTLPIGITSLNVSVVAVDRVGNRSAPTVMTLNVVANLPPSITFVSPPATTTLLQGQNLPLSVTVTDDVALGKIILSTSGAFSSSLEQVIPADQKSFTATLNLPVPVDAPAGGGVDVNAVAVDSAGNLSTPAMLHFTMADGVKPTALITAPPTGSAVNAGDTVGVVVTAGDNVGVTKVTLKGNGAVPFAEERIIAPALPSLATTFQVPVPANTAAGTPIILTAGATDAAGNSALESVLQLKVRDTVPPTVTVTVDNGVTSIDAGKSLSVTVAATDNVTVSSLSLDAGGAVTASFSQPVTPAKPTATATFTVAVPEGTPAGGTLTLVGKATDDSGNRGVSTPAIVTVTVHQVPALATITPASGASGRSVDVVITGVHTSFTQGQTTARFGAGIRVGGMAEDTPGSVTVLDANRISVHLDISPLAVMGARTVIVTTGTETLTLAGGFSVLPSYLPPPILLGPLAAGSTTVAVSNLFEGAVVTVFTGTTTLANLTVPPGAEFLDLVVPPLTAGQPVSARQQLSGVDSALSNTVLVAQVPASPRFAVPLFTGGGTVMVAGVTSGALVTVRSNGIEIGSGIVPARATSLNITILTTLIGGSAITADQALNGVTGPESPALMVIDPVAPQVRGPLAAGAANLTVDQVLPGTVVTVTINGFTAAQALVGSENRSLTISVPALTAGTQVTARQSAGGVDSAPSLPVIVGVTPPPPTVVPPLFDGTRTVLVSGVTSGATVDLSVDGVLFTSAVAAADQLAFSLTDPLKSGAVITAVQSVTSVVGSSSQPVTVINVGTPQVTAPLAAMAQSVVVTGATSGATVEVLVNGQIAGTRNVTAADGTVTVPVILLSAGDSVTARQVRFDVMSNEGAPVFVTRTPAAPAVAEPLLAGGELVRVTGVTSGAIARLLVDGAEQAAGPVPDGASVFDLHPTTPLAVNSVVTASQSLGGVASAASLPVTVIVATAPVLPAEITTELTQLDVSGIINGATVTVYANGVPLAVGIGSGSFGTLTLAIPRQQSGVALTVRQGAFGVVSPLSVPVTVTRPLPGLTITPATLSLSFGSSTPIRIVSSVPAPVGGVTITLTPAQPGIITASATVVIPEGQTETVATVTGAATGTVQLQATADGYKPGSVTCTVNPPTGTITLAVVGGSSLLTGSAATLYITLSRPAPTGGLTVKVVSSDVTKITVANNGAVTLAAGATTGQAILTPLVAGQVNLTASAPDFADATLAVTVSDQPKAPQLQSLGVTTIYVNGSSTVINVTGVGFTAQSTILVDGVAVATLFQSTTVLNFTLTGQTTVGTRTVTVRNPDLAHPGSFLVSNSLTVTVRPQPTVSLAPTKAVIGLGGSQAITVALSEPAPVGGLVVTLTSDTGGIITVPVETTVPQGSSSQQFTIVGTALGTTVLHATVANSEYVVGSPCSITVLPVQSVAVGPVASGLLGIQVGMATVGGGITEFAYSGQLGITVGSTTTVPAGIPRFAYSGQLGITVSSATVPSAVGIGPVASSQLGINVGSGVEAIAPAAIPVGVTTLITVRGVGLSQVTSISFIPSDGMTTGAITPAPDARSMTVQVTVATGSLAGPRMMLVTTATGTALPMVPTALMLNVGPGQ